MSYEPETTTTDDDLTPDVDETAAELHDEQAEHPVDVAPAPDIDPDVPFVEAKPTTTTLEGVDPDTRNAGDLRVPLHIPEAGAQPQVIATESYEDAVEKGFLGVVTRSPDRANED